MSQSARSGWPAWWMRRGPTAMALLPVAATFGLLARLRGAAYRRGLLRSWRAPVPVIVVGNLTVGGTGKTPLVAAIAAGLRDAGLRPGIISRGYGRSPGAPQPMEVLPDSAPADSGDEPLLLRRACGCPVWVGARRVLAAQALLRRHPEVDVLISDDGLQHLALQRDLELVVTDARGPGNAWPLPAGPLREPWSRRRDATLGPAAALRGAPAPTFALGRTLGAARRLHDGLRLSLPEFARRFETAPVDAVAAIGNPEQFFGMLRDAGVNLGETLGLPDHQAADPSLFAALRAPAVLLTEKDALKCEASQPAFERLWAVELQLHVDPAFMPWLLARLPTREPSTFACAASDGLPPA